MSKLSKENLTKLGDIIFRTIGCIGPNYPGAEYERLTTFFRDADLAPPKIEREFGKFSFYSENIQETKKWLYDYLSSLNDRKVQGHFFPVTIERAVRTLLSKRWAAHSAAADIEELLEPLGIALSWDRDEEAYNLVEIDSTSSARQDLPTLLHKYLGLHPWVQEVSAKLFYDGHYAEGVFEACKLLEQIVRDRLISVDSSCANLFGQSLMYRALDPKKPGIRINRLQSRTEEDEHEGFKMLLVGVTCAVRNKLAHARVSHDPYEALEYLALISLLVKRIESGEVGQDGKGQAGAAGSHLFGKGNEWSEK